jgi:hypothetical protein
MPKSTLRLYALNLDLVEDENKSDKIQAVGGCHALVQLLKNCISRAIYEIPACDQVTELNELAELTIIYNTLVVIMRLTAQHVQSRAGITAVGGVEVVVKVMKTFPKCQALQEMACAALNNLTYSNNVTGKKKANECDGIETIPAAINDHLGSAFFCEVACWALSIIIEESKETTGLLIHLGGAAAVAKVRTKWPDNSNVSKSDAKTGRLDWSGDESLGR